MNWQTALTGYWLAKRRQFSPHTIEDYERTFRRFGAWIGPTTAIQDIQKNDINAFLTHLKDDLDLASKTRLNHWIALSSLWTWMHKELGLEHIVRSVDPPPKGRRTKDPYTEEEVRMIITACNTFRAYAPNHGQHVDATRPTAMRDTAIVLVLVDTGIRASELCNLLISDYDQSRHSIKVRHGKGDKDRTLYLGDNAHRRLWRYWAEERSDAKPGAHLFLNINHDPMTRNSLNLMLRRAGKRAGVPNVGPHRFRHTFAINFLRNGGNVLELQALLGHETLETCRIYAKLAAVDLERAQRRSSVADHWRL